MDNLAHALVGAAVGRAVAGPRIRGAGLVGAVAGNPPGWPELAAAPGVGPPRSGLTYLEWHRGITHSLLGAAIEIAALTLLVGLGELWWSRRRGRPAAPWAWLALCMAAAVLSHLYLDWQGSYGLRPFLPWSGRWYYADWVAIVDPVFWLAPLVALLLGERRHWRPALVGLLTLGGVAWLVLSRGGDGVAGWLRLLTLTACGLAGGGVGGPPVRRRRGGVAGGGGGGLWGGCARRGGGGGGRGGGGGGAGRRPGRGTPGRGGPGGGRRGGGRGPPPPRRPPGGRRWGPPESTGNRRSASRR